MKLLLSIILLFAFAMSVFAQVEDYGKNGMFGNTDIVDRLEGFMGKDGSCKDATREEMNAVDDCIQSYSLVDPKNVKDFDNLTEELIFMEAARRTHQLGMCQNKLHQTYAQNQSIKAEINRNAFVQFQDIKSKIGPDLAKHRSAVKSLDSANFAAIGMVDDMKAGVAHVTRGRVIKAKGEVAAAQEKIYDLVARIPMGNRPRMRETLINLLNRQGDITEAQFNAAYAKTMQDLKLEAQKATAFFKRISFPDPSSKAGNQFLYTVNEDLKKSLARSGQVSNVVRAIQMEDKLAQSFSCRAQARYVKGPTNLALAELPFYMLGTYGIGRLAVRATVGAASATSKMASGAYKASKFASQMAMVGLNSYEWSRVADSVRESCIPQQFLSGDLDEGCSAETEVSGIYQEAMSAQCFTNAAMTAGPVMLFTASRFMGRAGKAEAAIASREAKATDTPAAEKVAEEPEIVVIGKRDPASLVVDGRKVNKSDMEELKLVIGDKLEDPAIRHFALNELSTFDHLPAKARQKEMGKLIVKVKRWESPTNIPSRKLNEYRLQRFKADVETYKAKHIKEHPDADEADALGQAERAAFKRRERSLALGKMCRAKGSNPAMDKAIKGFTKYSIGLGVTSTVGNYAYNHWHEVKDQQWAGRLGYELVMSVISSYLGSKLTTTSKVNTTGKIISSNVIGFGTNAVDGIIYSAFFSNDEAKAKLALEKLKQSPTFKEDLAQLEDYIKNKSKLEMIGQNLSQISGRVISAVTGKGVNEPITPEEIEALDKDALKDPVVQERLLDAFEGMMYAQEGGDLKFGDKGLDRLGFNTLWSLPAVPVNLAIQYFALQTVCRNIDNPAKAISFFAAIQLSRQFGLGYLYFRERRDAINQ